MIIDENKCLKMPEICLRLIKETILGLQRSVANHLLTRKTQVLQY